MTTQKNEDERLTRIRERAYEIWEEEGQPQGRSDIHWQRAMEEFDDAARQESMTQDAPAPQQPPADSDGGAAASVVKRRGRKPAKPSP